MIGTVSPQDRNILRTLAKRQLEYASLPIMHKRISEWYEFNDLKGKRPMVQVELWPLWEEVVSPFMQCQGDTARSIESELYKNYLNHELLDDDYPVPDFFPIRWNTHINLFNLKIGTQGTKDSAGNRSVGFRYNHPIANLPEDLPRLEKTSFSVDREAILARKHFLEEIFGDILPVRIVSSCLSACLTYHAVRLMGMEYMYTAMYDHSDEFHSLMKGIADSFKAYFIWQQEEKLLLPTNGRQVVGQGTWGFTRELPGPDYMRYKDYDFSPGAKPPEPITTNQSWGYCNSQESSAISPSMYGEFIFPYYMDVTNMFGLTAYGCCEPPDKIWEYVSKYKNLRKLSIPPWSNEQLMGDMLRGTNVIYARKPDPAFLGVGTVFDEEGYTAHMVNTLRAAKGCNLEITFRDIYTFEKDIKKARRAVAIVREQIENHWG